MSQQLDISRQRREGGISVIGFTTSTARTRCAASPTCTSSAGISASSAARRTPATTAAGSACPASR